jgi:deoxyribonuclease V
MFLALDAHYGEGAVGIAAVGFERPGDPAAVLEIAERVEAEPEPYQPGAFKRRELPFLLPLVARIRGQGTAIDALLVDGYAWLGRDRPGLGRHLHLALAEASPVVGIAKTRFAGAPAVEVLRGASRAPLFVTAAGMAIEDAAALVAGMHGPHRLPTLLGRVDRLARNAAAGAATIRRA